MITYNEITNEREARLAAQKAKIEDLEMNFEKLDRDYNTL